MSVSHSRIKIAPKGVESFEAPAACLVCGARRHGTWEGPRNLRVGHYDWRVGHYDCGLTLTTRGTIWYPSTLCAGRDGARVLRALHAELIERIPRGAPGPLLDALAALADQFTEAGV